MALHRGNLHEVPHYIRYATEVGAETACLIPIMPSGGGRDLKHLLLTPRDLTVLARYCDEVSRELGYLVEVWCLAPLRYILRSPWVRITRCRSRELMDLDPQGRVLLCDVLDLTVTDIETCGSLRRAYEVYCTSPLVSEVVDQVPEPCLDCPILEYCRGGCFARAHLLEGSLRVPDPLCPRLTLGPEH